MMYALLDGTRQRPQPGARARCPLCDSEVIAKCGDINTWHWAHLRLDCDSWSEGESEWHAGWKNLFPEDWREVVVGNHRADIRTPGGLVVEFQKSAISPEEIAVREAFYRNVVWVFDAEEAGYSRRLTFRQKNGYVGFRWRHARKSIQFCDAPVFLSVSWPAAISYADDYDAHGTPEGIVYSVLEIKKIYNGEEGLFSGWGFLHTIDDFVERVNKWEQRHGGVAA